MLKWLMYNENLELHYPIIQVCARQAMLFGLFEVAFVIHVSSVLHLTELETGFSV